MNIENIIKLLRSQNTDDNTLGFNILYKQCEQDLYKCNEALEETNLRFWVLNDNVLYLEIHGVVGNRIRGIKNHEYTKHN